jgi:hypothetical protein
VTRTASSRSISIEEFVQAENLSEDLTKLAQVARRILEEVNEQAFAPAV